MESKSPSVSPFDFTYPLSEKMAHYMREPVEQVRPTPIFRTSQGGKVATEVQFYSLLRGSAAKPTKHIYIKFYLHAQNVVVLLS